MRGVAGLRALVGLLGASAVLHVGNDMDQPVHLHTGRVALGRRYLRRREEHHRVPVTCDVTDGGGIGRELAVLPAEAAADSPKRAVKVAAVLRSILLHPGQMAVVGLLEQVVQEQMAGNGRAPGMRAQEIAGDARDPIRRGARRRMQAVLKLGVGIEQPTHPPHPHLGQGTAVGAAHRIVFIHFGDAQSPIGAGGRRGVGEIERAVGVGRGHVGADRGDAGGQRDPVEGVQGQRGAIFGGWFDRGRSRWIRNGRRIKIEAVGDVIGLVWYHRHGAGVCHGLFQRKQSVGISGQVPLGGVVGRFDHDAVEAQNGDLAVRTAHAHGGAILFDGGGEFIAGVEHAMAQEIDQLADREDQPTPYRPSNEIENAADGQDMQRVVGDVAQLGPAVVAGPPADLHIPRRDRAIVAERDPPGGILGTECHRARRQTGGADLHARSVGEVDTMRVGNGQEPVAILRCRGGGHVSGERRQFDIGDAFQQPFDGEQRQEAEEQRPPRGGLQGVRQLVITQRVAEIEFPVLRVLRHFHRPGAECAGGSDRCRDIGNDNHQIRRRAGGQCRLDTLHDQIDTVLGESRRVEYRCVGNGQIGDAVAHCRRRGQIDERGLPGRADPCRQRAVAGHHADDGVDGKRSRLPDLDRQRVAGRRGRNPRDRQACAAGGRVARDQPLHREVGDGSRLTRSGDRLIPFQRQRTAVGRGDAELPWPQRLGPVDLNRLPNGDSRHLHGGGAHQGLNRHDQRVSAARGINEAIGQQRHDLDARRIERQRAIEHDCHAQLRHHGEFKRRTPPQHQKLRRRVGSHRCRRERRGRAGDGRADAAPRTGRDGGRRKLVELQRRPRQRDTGRQGQAGIGDDCQIREVRRLDDQTLHLKSRGRIAGQRRAGNDRIVVETSHHPRGAGDRAASRLDNDEARGGGGTWRGWIERQGRARIGHRRGAHREAGCHWPPGDGGTE